MRFEMIDRDKRLPGGPRQTLGHHRTDDQPADQTGARGGRNPIKAVEADFRFRYRPPYHVVEMSKVRPRRDFGYDTAIRGVLDGLGMDQICPDRRMRRIADDRDCGFVAACLDAQDR
jgi:hypothetical protein